MDTSESSSENSHISPSGMEDGAGTSLAADETQPEGLSDRQAHAESRNSKVRSRRPHAAAYAMAMEMVDGDYTRLDIGYDGGVIILEKSKFDNQ